MRKGSLANLTLRGQTEFTEESRALNTQCACVNVRTGRGRGGRNRSLLRPTTDWKMRRDMIAKV